MGNAFIGKISALVTASTADLERKLRGSKAEVDTFGKSLSGTIARASTSAQSSLNGIFTPLQRLQRTLEIASRSRLNLFKPGQVEQIQRAVSVAEGLNKPIAGAQRQFSRLSANIQAEFLPALVAAQNKVIAVNNTLARTGEVSEQSFNRAGEAVDRTAQSLQRLEQLSRRNTIAGIGQSLEFRGAATATALARASAVGDSARQSPAFVRTSPQVQQNLSQLEAATERLILLQARYENQVARGQAGTGVLRAIKAQAAEVERLAQGYQTLAVNVGQARFDEVTAQATRALSSFSALGSVFQVTLRGLAEGVTTALSAFERTGQGADRAASSVARLSQAISAAAGVESIGRLLGQAQSAGGFERVVSQAEQAFAEFSRLSDPLRRQLLPALRAAAEEAAAVGTAIATGADSGRGQVTALQNRFEQLRDTIRDTALASEGLFRQPRDVRRTGELNQSVSQIDAQFRGFGAADRRAVQPFGEDARNALDALNRARISDAPANEIRRLETEYRRAVRSLEDVAAAVVQSKNAFEAATPAQRLFSRLDELTARYDRLSEAGKRAARDAAANARALTIAAQDRNASPTARTNARQAIDVAERDILRSERLDAVSSIFEQPRRDVDALLPVVRELESYFQGLPANVQASFRAVRTELQRTARDAADTGQGTEGRALSGAVDDFQNLRTQTDRLLAITEAWDTAIRGIPTSTQQIDREFQSLASRISGLGLEDRLNLDPLIRDFAESVRAGEPLIAQFQRLLTLRQQLEEIEERAPPPPTDLGNRLAEQGRRRVQALTGGVNIDSTPNADGFSAQAQRDIDALGARVGRVRQQLEELPNSLRQRFVPELQRAQAALIALQNSPRATVAAIEEARQAVARLEAQANRTGQALNFRERFGAGAGGFDRIFNDQAIRGYTAQLDILQNLLGTVSATARGPALVSFARLRDAIFRAFNDGTIGSEAAQREIRELTAEAARATAAVANVGVGRLQNRLNRAGDIGRRGFDKFSLAAQQAAFAIDDFFSVTGGLDQRIRAVGNNITQLGFIIGGTTGLFVTLGIVLASQLAVALVKFARGGAESESIAKALNDRLQKQKQLVQDVASGFDDLAGDIADSAFTEATKQVEQLEKRLDSLISKLKELRNNTASTLDPELVLLEGQRGTFERRLQSADNVPLAVARQARLRDVERRVRERQEVAERPRPISRAELQATISGSFGAGGNFQLGDDIPDRQILEILQQRQLELGRTVDSWFETFTAPFSQAEAGRLIAIVDDARRRLEADIAEAIRLIVEGTFSDSVRRFDAASRGTSESLGRAEQAGGVTNASRAARSAQEADGQRFRSVLRDFNKAVEEGRTEEARKAAVLLGKIADSAEARRRETQAIIDAANASERFVGLLGKFRELNDSILGDFAGTAEQARREAVQTAGTAAAGLSRPDDASAAQARSERLQRELEFAEDRRRAIESRIEEERRRFQQESPNPEVRRLVEEASRARALADDERASDAARAQARQDAIAAEQRLQQAFAASPQGQQLQARVDEADAQARVALERDSLIARGRELSLSEGQRAGRELGESIRAINEDFKDRTQRLLDQDPFADVAELDKQRRAAIDRTRNEAFRQAAPAIFGLADQVANAVLQGPSRAALQATDVSTVQGASELNRLLRGDDASRDQNLVELQKQSDLLQKLLEEARNPQVAN
jgi:hypothetical protein